MSDGRTSIRRPQRRASDAGRSRLGDLTRPIAREHSITQRLTSRLALGLAAATIALAIAVTLYVLPIRTWLDQHNELQDRQTQLDELESVNADLQSEVDRLQTDAGAREAARDEIGYLEPGEQRSTVIDDLTLPRRLPKGWPYSPVTQIIKIRTTGD
ncbi:MAG: septum formation initiator family protein [Acidimicrobiia bacterium]|nr:septum formation initiator family protein [Acidimicrobiia bacterium]MDQ3392011.1 septum formation initiator family protein [Actinomycetota bacterium]